VVVNSAGVAAYGRFEEVPAEIFDAVQSTNVSGSANVARAVLPRMRAADHGHLYLVGSITGVMGVPQMSAYVVSKWAIRALARALQLENRDRGGVTVTLVTPGGVDTPIYSLAANFQGRPGKPPPPIYSPEAVARAIVRSLDRPPRRLSVGVTNDVMALGFALVPRLYDLLVGPLFGLLTQERRSIEPTTGNVLDPVPEGDALHGRHAGLSRLPDRIRHHEL
jgi:short-subunit dehydrogenase